MKVITLCSLLTFFCSPVFLAAQSSTSVNQAVLIQDVVVGAQSANPRSFVAFKDSVFFLLRRRATSSLQLNRTNLTVVDSVKLPAFNTQTDSIASDVVKTNGDRNAATDAYLLWFFTRSGSNDVLLRSYNGANAPVEKEVTYGGLNDVGANVNFSVNSIGRVVAKPRNSLVSSTVYAEAKIKNGVNNTIIDSYIHLAPIGGNNRWADTLDRDYLGNSAIMQVQEGAFFTRKLPRPDEGKVEYRRDNGQPSSYKCVETQADCPKTVVGVGADLMRLLYYTKIGTTNQLWYYQHIDDGVNDPTFTREAITAGLGLEIGKPGIYYKNRIYFKTLNEGLWLFDTVRSVNLKAVKGFKYTASADSILYPVDSLSLAAGRAFFWAKTSLVPSGGLYEIFNDSAKILKTLNTNERLLKFIELDGKPYAITREAAISTLYRINSNSLTEMGKVNGIDILAGYAALNNTFVYSGNNNDGKGQEPYKLSLISPCDNDVNPPTFTNCPTNMTKIQANACGIVANWTEPTAIDNCAAPSVRQTLGLTNGACFPIGISTVTYSATDTSRRVATCTFTITVTANPCYNDTEKPKLTCPSSITTSTTQNCVAVFWSGPVVTDNCGTPNFGPSTPFRSGECIPVGVNRIKYTATDQAGNTDTCSFTVTIEKIIKTVDFDPAISKMTLSPNPTEGALWLTFDSQKARAMTFSIFNCLGIQLKDEKRDISIGQNRIELIIKDLPAGFYIIRPSFGTMKYAALSVVKL